MIASDVVLGKDVVIHHPELVNLYGCVIGDETRIGTFVEIQKGVRVGKRCKIQSHSFLCEGLAVGDGVFIGHGVMFINDRYPRALRPDGSLQMKGDWTLERIAVQDQVTIGSNASIIGGVTIGEGALVGAGAVVTKDVPPFAIVLGVPAKVVGDVRDRLERIERNKKTKATLKR